MRLPILVAGWSAAAAIAIAGTYSGAAACAKCHPEQFREQSATAHARALYPAAGHPLLAEFTPRAPQHRDPDFEFRFALDPRGLLVRVAAQSSSRSSGPSARAIRPSPSCRDLTAAATWSTISAFTRRLAKWVSRPVRRPRRPGG